MTTVDQANIARLDALKNDKKFINKVMWHYFWGDTAMFSMEMMMAPGIIEMLAVAAEDLYPGDVEKKKELLKNHNVFYNTQPNMTIVPGTVLGLEIERAKGNDIPNEAIQSIKAALAGAFAGIGDSIIQGIITPTLTSIGMGMCAGGSGIGAIFLWLSFFVICYPLGYYLFKLGLNAGAEGAGTLLEGEFKDRFIGAITIVGCIVVGAVTASTCSPAFKIVFNANGTEINLEETLSGIYPGLTVLLFLGITYTLMKKKKLGALPMLGIILAFSVVAYFTGLM